VGQDGNGGERRARTVQWGTEAARVAMDQWSSATYGTTGLLIGS